MIIKKFNENNDPSIKIITIVTFDNDCEYVKGLYIDNKLMFYGDSYHNKITEYIDGYINGIKYAKVLIDVEERDCTNSDINEDVCENGGSPPKNLDDIN